MKGDSPEEIGFVIGAMAGFVWIVRSGPHYGRGVGTANLIFMMICGGIGWLAGSAWEWLSTRLH
jgi:hypothetical protein